MAIELITGKAGAPHIDSADIGAYQAYTMGEGVYILHGMEAAIAGANAVTVAAGDMLAEGRHVRITGASESLTLDNGQGGYKRNDVIAMHYTRDGSGVESAALVVIKGTPTTGEPTDPPMPNAGKVLNNASDAYWPLYRVPVDGLAPQTPVALAEDFGASKGARKEVRTATVTGITANPGVGGSASVTWETPFPDEDYEVVATPRQNGTAPVCFSVSTKSAEGVSIDFINVGQWACYLGFRVVGISN